MEIAKPVTPEKSSTPTTYNNGYRYGENLNPNVSDRSPVSTRSSDKSQKSISKNPIKNPFALRQRKFVVAKKNNTQNQNDPVSCKCKDKEDTGNNAKCPCVAYQNLRASQEDFFKKKEEDGEEEGEDVEEEEAESVVIEENEELEGSGVVKRRRERVLEEARNSVPENGAGRVMHLVKAFEKLLSIPNSKKKEEQHDDNGRESKSSNSNVDNNKKRVMKWALPGLQLNHQKHEAEVSASDTNDSNSSLFCASDLVLTSQNLGLDQTVSISSSWDSSRASVSSRTSSGGRRSRRNSLESSGTIGGRRWKKKKQLKVTSQKPFKLRTEQRGKLKEEEFMSKIQQMMTEEEKLRIPIAQGLPWTTDEPECLVKPPVKESTKPIDLKLHSDVRAVDRAEFDHQVAEKMSLMEQYRLERERQQKLAEEEEIRRLRKELIPKAQPMPYFDRPFVPRRSMKHPTIPREPKFHIPQHKKIKCCSSWNDMSPYFSYLK